LGLPTTSYRPAIDGMAQCSGLPPWHYRGVTYRPGTWLEGLVLQESSGNPKARRYEPHQDRAGRRDAPTDADQADHDDGELEDDASYGLCQVMGYNARVLCGVPPGTPMRFGFLFLPLINLSLGLRIVLAELRAVRDEVAAGKTDPGQDVERALCRYNGGPTGDDDAGGDFRLRAYVDKVALRAAQVRTDRG
jgi:hypothetical protein